MIQLRPETPGPWASVILDSLHPNGLDRVTTMVVMMHRFVLAEFNTPRAFSRNSESSRAVPASQRIRVVEAHPALPVEWPLEKSGMQGGDAMSGIMKSAAYEAWLADVANGIMTAKVLHEIGLHKSLVNRRLESDLWHLVIVTGTNHRDSYPNFFLQRCSPLAQPEMRAAAEAMKKAYDASTPNLLRYDEWHMPLVTGVDLDELQDHYTHAQCQAISAARCARVSYSKHDKEGDPEADLARFDKLVNSDPPHWSPLEHVCTPLSGFSMWRPGHEERANQPWIRGNLVGFSQLRHHVQDGMR